MRSGVDRAPAPARPVTPVSILADLLGGVVRDLESAGTPGNLVEPDLLARLRRARDLAAGLDPYLERCTSPPSPALADLAASTSARDWDSHALDQQPGGPVGPVGPVEAPHLEQEMLSGHVEGELLATLVAATGARRVLEIGMFTGYASLAMAEALPAAPGSGVVALELDPGVAELARRSFATTSAGDRIEVRVGPAATTLADLADAGQVFDLVFLDADKAGYAGYVDVVLERGLLARDGLLVVDNTLLQGEPWLAAPAGTNGAAVRDFNDRLAADPRVRQVLVPLRDGVTLARRTPQP